MLHAQAMLAKSTGIHFPIVFILYTFCRVSRAQVFRPSPGRLRPDLAALDLDPQATHRLTKRACLDMHCHCGTPLTKPGISRLAHLTYAAMKLVE
ncbi:MAG: hypothetical protein VCC00_04640 [Deltaproteobacteria bacterium]